jgi:DNA polymerase III sliding clamp (beta) subunit (PCNA family)
MTQEKTKLFETYTPLHLVNLLECVAAIKDEVRLRFNENGISVLEMDKNHWMMVDLNIKPAYFETYNPYNNIISINIKSLLNVLGKITKDDSLIVNLIPYEETGYNPKLEFVIKGTKRLTRTKTVSSIEPIEDEVPVPKIYFKSKTRLLSEAFKFAVDDLKGTSEHITLSSNEEGLTLKASGDESVDTTSFLKGDDNTLDHKAEEDSNANFANIHISSIMKPIVKVSEVVNIHYAQDMLVRIEAELSPSMGTLVYHIAPCINV